MTHDRQSQASLRGFVRAKLPEALYESSFAWRHALLDWCCMQFCRLIQAAFDSRDPTKTHVENRGRKNQFLLSKPFRTQQYQLPTL